MNPVQVEIVLEIIALEAKIAATHQPSQHWGEALESLKEDLRKSARDLGQIQPKEPTQGEAVPSPRG